MQKILIVTGMSGAGKTIALSCLEDEGFFCVDNLPAQMCTELFERKIIEDCVDSLAICIDSRSADVLSIEEAIAALKNKSIYTKVIFLTAHDDVLTKRYSETRRKHPMSKDGFISKGIAEEREQMNTLFERADFVIDTSETRPSQLHEIISNIATDNSGKLVVNIRSFGFKHSIPLDSDWMFDVRFLPNPFWIPELRGKTGMDKGVIEYIEQFEGTEIFCSGVVKTLLPLIEMYYSEGKRILTISIGCTGGQHRSVFIAEKIGGMIRKHGERVIIKHRDIDKIKR